MCLVTVKKQLMDLVSELISWSSIVFVSGLESQRRSQLSTWKAKFFWPTELLPNDVPNVRILVWKFAPEKDANAAGPSIGLLGEKLLRDLMASRKTSEAATRPVIFIAHSLGGLIVKSVY